MIPRRRALAALLAVLGLALAAPAVFGHATLTDSDPVEGGSIATPYVLVLRFDEELNPDDSSVVVRDAAGSQVAEGGPIDDNFTMAVELPALPVGAYQAHWIAITADDNGKTQGDLSFTVAAATAPPSVTPVPSVSPTYAAPSTTPSATATALPTAAFTPSPAPTASPGPTEPATSGTELIVPLVLAGAVAVGLVWFLLRRRPS